MSTIYLVSCVSKKAEGPTLAKHLYCSPWFRKARTYVESKGCDWFILSARFHLVKPNQELPRYNKTLSNKKAQRREWAEAVLMQLKCYLDQDTTVVILAGTRYREYLADWLEMKGIDVCVPMKGLRIGEQLRWLNENL